MLIVDTIFSIISIACTAIILVLLYKIIGSLTRKTK